MFPVFNHCITGFNWLKVALTGQVEHLRQLNNSGQAEAVVTLFEGQRVAFSQETLGGEFSLWWL